MTLIKCNPQSPAVMNEFDRVWSDFFGRRYNQMPDTCAWAPRVDILEDAKQFQVVAELPGFEKSDFRIKVENETLIIGGERKFEDETKERQYRRVERAYGTFERRFRLPKEAQADQIDAEYKNGVLTISIPKSEKVGGREIQVR